MAWRNEELVFIEEHLHVIGSGWRSSSDDDGDDEGETVSGLVQYFRCQSGFDTADLREAIVCVFVCVCGFQRLVNQVGSRAVIFSSMRDSLVLLLVTVCYVAGVYYASHFMCYYSYHNVTAIKST